MAIATPGGLQATSATPDAVVGHSLIRDVLSEMRDPRERCALHRAAAEALERMHPRNHRSAVAHHLVLAGMPDDLARRALDGLVRTGRRDERRGTWWAVARGG